MDRFQMETLAQMDSGRIKDLFEAAFARCERDCRDRATLAKDRTVSLIVKLRPEADAEGKLVEVIAQFQVKCSEPIQQTRVYHLIPGKANQGLLFEDIDESVMQAALEKPKQPKATPARKDRATG